MKVEIAKSKLLSVSLIAILGASFLTSCNNKKSSPKEQNQQTSTPGTAGGGAAGGGEAGGGAAGGGEAGGADKVTSEETIASLDLTNLTENENETVDVRSLPHASTTILPALSALRLEEKHGIGLRIRSLCGDGSNPKNLGVFNNGKHNTPVVFELYDENGLVKLDDAALAVVRESLFIRDHESGRSAKLTDAEMTPTEFTRCANGEVPVGINGKNVFYIKPSSNSATKMRLIASLEIEEGIRTIYSVPTTSTYKDALTIPVLQNKQQGKTDLFEKFEHKFKVVDQSTKDKYKYLTAKYKGKDKDNKNIQFNINNISISDKNKFLIDIPAEYASLRYENNLRNLKIGTTELEFFAMGTPKNRIQSAFEQLFSRGDFKFSKVADLDEADLTIQKSKEIGFLIKIDDIRASTNPSDVIVKLTGTDSFGNDFVSIIKDTNW